MKRSQPLESHMYGDPMAILERKQAQEERQRKRGTLHAKSGWSDARKRAEALFTDFADSAAQPSTSRILRNGDRPGASTGKNT
ncbi:hypothetical protein FAZ98_31325 [Paraburkholderia acidisoli]|nr:hypothetical protein FAZ98_31325 [Paraburkholderia acidisoli]